MRIVLEKMMELSGFCRRGQYKVDGCNILERMIVLELKKDWRNELLKLGVVFFSRLYIEVVEYLENNQ